MYREDILNICYSEERAASVPRTVVGCLRGCPERENIMSYTELSDEDQIILAAECVGRGVPIPREIKEALGADLISVIENPGATHEQTNNANEQTGNGINPSGFA